MCLCGMEGLTGLEPAKISCLEGRRASQLRYNPLWCRRPDSNWYGTLVPSDFRTTLCHHSPNNQWLIDGLDTSFNSILQIKLFEHHWLLSCSLDSIFTISYDLGGWCIVSTHYALLHIGTVFPIRFYRLANFYSKGFPLGTLYDFS